MPQLIAVVVAIAIMAFAFTGGKNYINVDAFNRTKFSNQISQDLQTLKQGRMLYSEHTDSILPTASWETEFEKYTFLPTDVLDLSWTYNKNGYGTYFCLTGNTKEEVLYEAILKSAENLSSTSYYINTNCGSTTNFALDPDFSTTQTISATFYVK